MKTRYEGTSGNLTAHKRAPNELYCSAGRVANHYPRE